MCCLVCVSPASCKVSQEAGLAVSSRGHCSAVVTLLEESGGATSHTRLQELSAVNQKSQKANSL